MTSSGRTFSTMNASPLFFNVISSLLAVSFCQDVEPAGPYIAKIESLDKCDDEGTKDFSFIVEYDQVKDTFSGAFYKKKDLGDNVLVTVEVEHLAGDTWVKEFSLEFGGACRLMRGAPDAMENFLQSINIRDCPILEGTNIVRDLKNDFVFPFIKTMKNGKRKIEVIFTDKENSRMGCVRITGNIIPKPQGA